MSEHWSDATREQLQQTARCASLRNQVGVLAALRVLAVGFEDFDLWEQECGW